MRDSLTLLLARARGGDSEAEDNVFRLANDRLRQVARALLRTERPDHTLQATALVSELFLKKFRGAETLIRNTDHFYAMAATAMRQVLIDYGRFTRAQRRRMTPEVVADLLMRMELPSVSPEECLGVRAVFVELAKLDRGAAECIRCRFIAGMTVNETAERMSRPTWKVRAECDFGLQWMASRLREARPGL